MGKYDDEITFETPSHILRRGARREKRLLESLIDENKKLNRQKNILISDIEKFEKQQRKINQEVEKNYELQTQFNFINKDDFSTEINSREQNERSLKSVEIFL